MYPELSASYLDGKCRVVFAAPLQRVQMHDKRTSVAVP